MIPHPEVVDWAEYGLEPVDHEEIINLTDTESDTEEVNEHVLPADPGEAQEVINLTDTESDTEEVDEHDLPTEPWEDHVQEQQVSDTDSEPESVSLLALDPNQYLYSDTDSSDDEAYWQEYYLSSPDSGYASDYYASESD